MKQYLLIIWMILFVSTMQGQIRIVNDAEGISNAENSSAFIDASSNITVNNSKFTGKGLLFPRTDLAGIDFFGGTPIGSPNSYPTFYDGMIVYNTANGGVAGVGSTEGTLCRGFWFYDNPTTSINGGTWRPLKTVCSITSLDCNTIARTGTLTDGAGASGVSFTITYNGGNGSSYGAQSVPSMGVTGLTAELAAGNFTNGTGTLTYTITGTPSGSGTALFDINIGGKQCLAVPFPVGAVGTAVCGAYIAPGIFREFMCHNLGADTSLDPHTPVKGLNGDYYQWGRKFPAATVDSPSPVSGWITTSAPDGAWLDLSKTSDDPCPSGYRVPTKAMWEALGANNTVSRLGTWVNSETNFGSALVYTNGSQKLTLPAAGDRYLDDGSLNNRGMNGYYWSSTQNGTLAYELAFASTGNPITSNAAKHTYGFSVRCIEDAPAVSGTITSLDCNTIVRTGTLTDGAVASGVSFTITYDGGNGGSYGAQSVPSMGVTGLTAELAAGNFTNGTGTLTYTITGTPSGSGTALFDINIGGRECLDVPFTVGTATTACGAYIAPGVYREFMCHNLGADTSLDPFIPAAGLGGAKYQWGRITPALTQTEDQTTYPGVPPSWNTTPAPDGSWLDTSKTANDPCPAGYRVPTATQWQGVIDNNTAVFLGPWLSGAPYYDSAIKYGANLMLLSAGDRNSVDGYRIPANAGYYWSSTMNGTQARLLLFFGQSQQNNGLTMGDRTWGFSIRCIKNTSSDVPPVLGTITSLDCNTIAKTGALTDGAVASGVSFTITYGGGDGGSYGAQSVPSTGVTGLTAELAAGNFTNGTGTLTYTITGTPSGSGTALFDISIGGEQCPAVSFTVGTAAVACGAYIAPGVYKEFMCYNLGADTSLDPFIPAAGLGGAKYQWGRVTPALTQTEDQTTYPGVPPSWNTTPAPDGSWLDTSKTANDPCPVGYRVPTATQWQGIIDNNTTVLLGPWLNGAGPYYDSAIKYGANLMLLSAGDRDPNGDKILYNAGYYWSSTMNGTQVRALLFYGQSQQNSGVPAGDERTWGYSIRCIKE
jgi:uncharacterized protein (TIGR02145 family)